MRRGIRFFPAQTRSLGTSLVIVLAMTHLTCNETLPLFEDPTNVIRAGVLRERYVLVVDDNSMEFTLTVRNIYDETLEGVTSLNGTLDITLKRLSSVHRSVAFDYRNLTTPGKFNTSTKTFRFDPGDSVVFRIRWDFVDDSGDSLKNTVFRYYADPGCPYRCFAEQEVFTVTASLRLFDAVPATQYGPSEFTVCHVSNWVDGISCPPISTLTPCSYFAGTQIPCSSNE